MTARATHWEVVRDCHHFYSEDDCHRGFLTTDAATGGQRFTGEVGRYRWQATVTLGIPYCSSCDKPITGGVCMGCEIIHADLVPLTDVTQISPGRIAA